MIFGDLGCLGDLITRNARRFPNQEGIVYQNTRLSWKEINVRVNRFANALLSLGIRPGERLAILGKNSHRYIEVLFAGAKTGIILAKINYRASQKEITYMLKDCDAKAICFDADFASEIRHASKSLKNISHFIALDQQVESALDYETLLAESQEGEPPRNIGAEDVVMIQYTSGTTGRPKGAMMTHGGQIILANNCAIDLGKHRAIVSVPLCSAAGTRYYAHVYLGNPLIILKEFDSKILMETIQREQITWMALAPSMFYLLMDQVPNISEYDTSSVRRILYGSSPITVSQLRIAMDLFEECEFEGGYGLTETGPYGCNLLPEEHDFEGNTETVTRLGSVGRMKINGMLRIVGSKDEELPCNEVGEICIRCDSNMVGYWNKPEETAQTLRNGWVYTGDLGERDEDGYIFLRDRKKDMIITGGLNVYPKEIEDLLNSHHAILESAVIGIPDEKWGEAIMAVVVCERDFVVTEKELIEYCRENLASYKKPRRIEFVEELPKNTLLKVNRHILRKHYSDLSRFP